MTLLLSLSVQGLSVSLRGPCYCLSLCKNLTVVSHSSVMYFNLHGASCYWSLPGSFSNSDSKAIHLQFFNIFISYIQYICRKCIMSILTRGLLLFFLPESDDTQHFAVCLMNAFWKLHSCQPVNPVLSPLSSIGERVDKLETLKFKENSSYALIYQQ